MNARTVACGRALSLAASVIIADAAAMGQSGAMVYPGMSAFPSARMGGRWNQPRVWDEAMLEEEELSGADDPAERGGAEDRLNPKTDLGRLIIRQDLRRDAQTVLSARATLAAERRMSSVLQSLRPDRAGLIEPMRPRPRAGQQPIDNPAIVLPTLPPIGRNATVKTRAEAAEEQEILRLLRGVPGGDMMSGIGEPPFDPDDPALDDPEGAEDAANVPGMTPEQIRQRREQMEKLQKRAEHFRLLVVAGDWPRVGAFLKSEAGEDAGVVYEWMLATLRYSDSALVPDEVLEISEAAPGEMTDRLVGRLGALLKGTQQRGCQPGAVAARIAQGTRHFGGDDPASRKRAAGLLVAAGLPIQAQAYLAPLATARAERDVELLNLYAIYFAALAKERTGPERESAVEEGWRVCMDALNVPNAPARERSKSLARVLGFLDDVPAETGDAWLTSLFAVESDLGWETIERVNRQCRLLRERSAPVDRRMKGLERTRRVGRAILAAEPGVVSVWRTGLNMLTLTVLEETEFTRSMASRQMPNYGYGGYDDGDQAQAIPAETLGRALPDAQWLAAIDPGLASKLELMAATTAGGAGDVEAVVDMIRPIVDQDPERAKKLAEALLLAWPGFARKGLGGIDEDPYGSGGRFGMMYGGWGGRWGAGQGGIPLTRARQGRNLAQLRTMIERLQAVGIDPIPTDPLVAAFASAYSQAEVYTRDDLERVFGSLQSMDSGLRLKLATRMREQLAGAWRSPQVQEQAGTRRTSKELAAEVERGYELADQLCEQGEETWERLCLLGDLAYDRAEFAFGQGEDVARYQSLRTTAFERYARAANLYAAELAAGRAKPSGRIFAQWFSAAMGASDLGYLTRQDRPDLDQVKRVMDAIGGLDQPMSARHVGLFAQEISRSMQRMAPELKPRFLRQAVRIIGDHPDGQDARSRLALYDDLEKEVELGLELDGSSDVGTEPFGVHVFIRSSRAVGREGGGFAKYLMNEVWSPTGSPMNYRDEFEKQVREKWAGPTGFEVLSVTFHKPVAQRLGDTRTGWERTPLCFVVLRAKDPSAEHLSELKLDMDFSDGQGLVVLPVGSNPLSVSSARRGVVGAASVVRDLEIEQVLDDRESASSGVIRVDVRASGKGLIPALPDLLLDRGERFGDGLAVRSVEDHGLSVTDLQTETGRVVPVTERTWTLTLGAAEGNRRRSATFAFAGTAAESAKVVRRRYSDADLASATERVAVTLPGGGGAGGWGWLIGLAAVAAGTAGGWLLMRRQMRPRNDSTDSAWAIPEHLTPVGAIGMLRRVEALNGTVLSVQEQQELTEEIEALERAYFAPVNAGGQPGSDDAQTDLRRIVSKWAVKAQRVGPQIGGARS